MIVNLNMFRNVLAKRLHKTNNYRNLATVLREVDNMWAPYKVQHILKKWKKIFDEKDVDEPESSINNIVAHVLGTKKISDVSANVDKYLTLKQIQQISRMCEMRLEKKPIQYIIGEWDFKNLTLKMREPVFIPRPETEQIVDLTLAQCHRGVTEILELCCGSGAISLALLKANSKLKITAVDKLPEACELTKENAKIHNVSDRIKILQKTIEPQNVENFLRKRFQVIVCNAPYIPTADIGLLQPEIRLYENEDALDGGEDGLKLIKLVLKLSSHLLEAGGKVILEVDRRHPEFVKAYLQTNPAFRLLITGVHKDICNRDRFITLKKQ